MAAAIMSQQSPRGPVPARRKSGFFEQFSLG
jgi:hypothetical protein